tara:strand:- start:35499 stop:36242 length:744 start_codon:yes stop_codon:yes gene_type:complete
MKKIMLVSILSLLALSSYAGAYIAGQNDFWKGSQMVTAGVYGSGKISLEVMNKDFLTANGYSLSIKSPLKDEWKYEKGGYEGKVVVNRRGPGEFDSIVIQNKNFDRQEWTDLSVFGEGNTLLRRTVCEERKCFVISNSICDRVAKTMGKDARGLTSMQAQCANLSTAFKTAMTEEKKSNLDVEFAADVKKMPSNPLRGRNIVMGDNIDASAKNLYAYLSHCESLKNYNSADVVSSGPRASSTGDRAK